MGGRHLALIAALSAVACEDRAPSTTPDAATLDAAELDAAEEPDAAEPDAAELDAAALDAAALDAAALDAAALDAAACSGANPLACDPPLMVGAPAVERAAIDDYGSNFIAALAYADRVEVLELDAAGQTSSLALIPTTAPAATMSIAGEAPVWALLFSERGSQQIHCRSNVAHSTNHLHTAGEEMIQLSIAANAAGGLGWIASSTTAVFTAGAPDGCPIGVRRHTPLPAIEGVSAAWMQGQAALYFRFGLTGITADQQSSVAIFDDPGRIQTHLYPGTGVKNIAALSSDDGLVLIDTFALRNPDGTTSLRAVSHRQDFVPRAPDEISIAPDVQSFAAARSPAPGGAVIFIAGREISVAFLDTGPTPALTEIRHLGCGEGAIDLGLTDTRLAALHLHAGRAELHLCDRP